MSFLVFVSLNLIKFVSRNKQNKHFTKQTKGSLDSQFRIMKITGFVKTLVLGVLHEHMLPPTRGWIKFHIEMRRLSVKLRIYGAASWTHGPGSRTVTD
jgi:hypothetical protein